MKRRWLCAALALSMVLTMTACNSDGKESEGTTTAAATTAEETTAPAGTDAAGETVADIASLPKYNAADFVSLDNYTGMEVEVEDGEVTDEEFEQLIGQLLNNFATIEQITDRETAEGDTINFDYSGSMDGEVFQGGTAKGQTTKIGQGGWIDGFEEGLVGRPCGEEYVIDAHFPDPYPNNPDFAGKTAQFTITIHYIHGETILPELNDEFVKGLEGYNCSTVEEFEETYREELTQQKTEFMETQAINAMWTQLIEKATFSGLPEGYVDAYTQDMLASYTQNAAVYGFGLEEFAKQYGYTNLEAFTEMVTAEAEQQVKSEVLYQYIAAKENLTATEEDYLAMVEDYMEYYGYTDMTTFINTVGVELVERQGYADALFEKVLRFCFDSAVKVPAPSESVPEETTAQE